MLITWRLIQVFFLTAKNAEECKAKVVENFLSILCGKIVLPIDFN